MSFSSTYSYDWDRSVPSVADETAVSRGMLWTMVHQLTGQLGGLTEGIWTCAGSSDGTTAGMDGNNRWWNAGVFSAALMPYSGSGVRGWMVLKSPDDLLGGPIWLNIYLGPVPGVNDGSDTYCLEMFASTLAPTGGTTTARPTASTSEIALYWAGSADYYGSSTELPSWRLGGDANTRKCYLTLAADGGFFWAAGRPGLGISCGMMVCPLLDTEATDHRGLVIHLGSDGGKMDKIPWGSSVSGVNAGSPFSVGHLNVNYNPVLNLDVAIPRTHRSMWGFAAISGDSTAVLNYGTMTPAFLRVGNINTGWQAQPGIADPAFVNTWTLDRIRNRYLEMPIYVYTARNVSASFNSIRGKLRDLNWGLGIAEGTNDPEGTSPITRVTWGDIWFPSPDQIWAL